ncbi:glycerol-3-phosphate responsive antiterminator [Oceanobacillus piezotolerans]|uniref:Glycerol uptake operon antiterminator regulatory protein n=1 Tax=Oceanobacillus piezotolerans TaxID=2448030 RepID=A0A498D8C3_9BACI|nr:glycerol-3-phosphate responsive antiterminator [Oceanobacillus piezotolerans]RLL46633.1 glycerol-3-phosphate responsive antiterminator [Oceanobacillus piezotolerans]
MDIPTGVLPAIRRMKDFERALESDNETIVLLETRLSQLKSLIQYAKRENKRVLVHFDLIQGLKADEYGMEFLIREIKPDGILSTRGNVITLAKKQKLLAIQRMFLLDSLALETNLKQIDRIKPDCVEVLPGIMPAIIRKIIDETNIPIIAGGLITGRDDIDHAFDAGAVAVTTSNMELWKYTK